MSWQHVACVMLVKHTTERKQHTASFKIIQKCLRTNPGQGLALPLPP